MKHSSLGEERGGGMRATVSSVVLLLFAFSTPSGTTTAKLKMYNSCYLFSDSPKSMIFEAKAPKSCGSQL